MIESDEVVELTYKFTRDKKLNEEVSKEFKIYMGELYKTLTRIFGDIQIRNLEEFHRAAIENRVADLAKVMISYVEGHWLSDSVKQADASTANLITAVFAGMNAQEAAVSKKKSK